jgi:hypothetical protein
MAPVLLVCPDGDFGTSHFKGNDILRHLTSLGNM